MNLGIVVQAHPARYTVACDLARQLPGCVQVYDPKPHERQRSAWRTYRWCLERSLVEEWTHLLVIQEDAFLCQDFMEVLPRVVEAQPDKLIALFVAAVPLLSARAVHHACWEDLPFATLPTEQWVPAIADVWPTDRIREALSWVDAQGWKPDFTADDEIIGRICRNIGLTAVATAPSLVEHPDVLPSIAGPRPPLAGRDPNRVAFCFADPDCDLREVDWTAGVWR